MTIRRIAWLHDLVQRFAWLGAGAATGRLLPLVVLLVASRRMEPQQFASASAAFAWAGVSMSLTSSGLATVMAQRLGAIDAPKIRCAIFSYHSRRAVSLAIALALTIVLLGVDGARNMFGSALDPKVVLPAAIAGALWSQVSVCVAALNGCHKARAASTALAVCGLLQGTGMATGLLWGYTNSSAIAWGLVAGSTFAALFAAWLVRLVLGRHTPAEAVWRPPFAPLWRSHIVWNTLASALFMPVSFAASGMLARGEDGTRQLAQYFGLEQVHQMLVYVPAVLGQALLPMLSRRFGASASGDLTLRHMAIVVSAGAAAGLALAGLIAAAAPWLLLALANPALQPGDEPALRWMLLSAGLGLGLSLLGAVLIGAGRIVFASSLNLVWATVFLGLTMALLAQGNVGLQAARFAASAAILVIGVGALTVFAMTKPRRPA